MFGDKLGHVCAEANFHILKLCFLSWQVLASHMLGNVIVRSPSVDDTDQREMFYIHILPGSVQSKIV